MPLDLPLVRPGAPGSEQTAGQDGDAIVRRSVLPGGVRVLTEQMPGLRSATVGAWVGVGSRDETSGHYGSTHFLEHLLFKGTARRSAMDIAEAFDAVGGEANAATGKEHTCYYARVLDDDLPMAVDVIADMVTSARLDTDELETERGVILEELAMNDDDPSDVVHEQFAAAVLGEHPLGRPIGGTPDTIRAVPRDAVWEHYRWHYTPATLVVTAAGGVDHDTLCGQVADALAAGGWALDGDDAPTGRRPLTASSVAAGVDGIPADGVELTIQRHTEQANVIVGGTALTATDPRRFTLSVLNAVLGGGMSSRLFQEIREKRGLAYSTYSFASGHADTGVFGLYAGCAPGKVDEVVELMVAEWERLADGGITPAELERSLGQLAGGLVLGMEDTGSRMSRLGKAELVHGELLSIDESLDRIRAVTAADVQELAAELASRPRSVVRVGPFGA
ncbi:M16 family metallopeptidase [Cellulomonas fimi]|uniref:Peptidase M16 domain protein n=1 Tax=Cellulomonas fimi (strain ATCC 484 / DSM 20113 / JCM 1341 / CCUG 24087 / LMG 16345 / NBRC 15513 / NCIMB 8980 / NCTC 7547 / NRS-133) TaxID=590998 RepID=F4H741_CELFA|nr:pitrilysin family protein [Cellulomonas fimi]AEE45675.1 peptidase M16 domain protein [Cellulomonas fimi ATCC 484]NNH07408.1 insulinase family protein [Cellulomonas fimi]VEH30255.1 Protease 3 precursor [Cellulomonas fimi]